MSSVAKVTGAVTVVFALGLASLDPVDLLLGALLGTALGVALRGRLAEAPAGEPGGLAPRLAAVPGFALAVLVDVAQGTWDVALRVLHLRPINQPGVVLVPIGRRTPQGVAVTALIFTLSPGSVLVDIDWPRGMMLVHVIDAGDANGVRDRFARLYDRHQRRVFP